MIACRCHACGEIGRFALAALVLLGLAVSGRAAAPASQPSTQPISRPASQPATASIDPGDEVAALRAEIARLRELVRRQAAQIQKLNLALAAAQKAAPQTRPAEKDKTRPKPFKAPPPGCINSEIRPGMTGYLASQLRVLDILGPNSMLVEAQLDLVGGYATASYLPLVRRELLLRGVPTAGLADDSTIRFNGDFVVVGTTTEQPIEGVRGSVYILEPSGKVSMSFNTY